VCLDQAAASGSKKVKSTQKRFKPAFSPTTSGTFLIAKNNYDCIEAYEKMSLLLTWFIPSVNIVHMDKNECWWWSEGPKALIGSHASVSLPQGSCGDWCSLPPPVWLCMYDYWTLDSVKRLWVSREALYRMNDYYLRIENAEGYVLIAVYLFICMRVNRITQKVLNRIAWNLVGWLVIIRGTFD